MTMPIIFINLYCKFRAFGITFGTVRTQVRLDFTPKLQWSPDHSPFPENAKVPFNERGVKLTVWSL